MKLKQVPNNRRSSFLVRHFSDALFDSMVFNIADKLIEGYQGGYWEYMEADSTGFLMLKQEEPITLNNPFSGEQVDVDDVLAGMIVTLYALNWKIERKFSEMALESYEKLRELTYDYANDKGMMSQAFIMLD